MRNLALTLVGPACALAVLLVVNRAVLFQGEQFAFRDVSEYYYPLHQRIQQEWQAGRWPLWDPWRNGGQPLLGNPTAAVLYPGKLVFAVFPMAWAARLHVIGHTVLAFAGMIALARSLGLSPTGAGLAALAYAFGAPVLFLYGNVIYLVGAAWLPWGLRAVDRLVRSRHLDSLPSLAVVLALQTLGGDPQAAFLTLITGAGYAAWLTLREQGVTRFALPIGIGLTGLWVVATLTIAWLRPEAPGWVGTVWAPALVVWLAAIGAVVWTWRNRPLGTRFVALIGAGALALMIAGAQLVPIAEFSALSNRAGGVEPTTAFKFSVEPYRLVETFWPLPFGRAFPENRSWLQAIPPAADRQIWEPSLYLGGLVVVLALIGAGSRAEPPPWRPWFTALALLSLLAAFGRFGSPLWWVRWLPQVGPILGPHDPILNQPRADGFLHDGAGSPYALLTACVPGFGLFRYPAKLLTFTAAAVAVLAGAGWDGLIAGRSLGFRRLCLIGFVASALGWLLASLASVQAVAFLSERVPVLGIAGPPDVAGAWFETRRSLAHGTLVFAAGLVLARLSRRPNLAGAIGLVVVAIDLATAGSRLIWTAPQASFDTPPEVARRISEAERADPSPGPFRIHRLSAWQPDSLLAPGSPARPREILDWERATLAPLHALPLNLEYCVAQGVIDRDDQLDFFHPQTFAANPETARALKVPTGDPVCYYPRRSYDLWGARYLILPARPLDWSTESRGYASFAFNTEVVWPSGLTASERERWDVREDWQLVRNKAAYPRAWLVHAARIVAPATDPESRGNLMRQIVYQNDPIWSNPGRPVFNPRELAWIETDDPLALRGIIASVPVERGESVTVTRHDPDRVELLAHLNRPGLVILADTFFPGWRLTIDGRPAPILRANRLMRAAAVPSGRHLLVYDYDPWSFRIGLGLSALGVALLATMALTLTFARR